VRKKLRVLDLFSGIGGFSLGLEATGGFETVAFCEIEKYPQQVLAKHWPGVPIYGDVRELTAARLATDGIGVDVITGGFPCQDISNAGKGAGIGEGTRSGLWSEIARLVGELRPRYVIVENVTALLSGDSGRWFGRVLGDLAALGYDAEWHCIPASELGAHHHRDRVWVVAYTTQLQRNGMQDNARKYMEGWEVSQFGDCGWEDDVANSNQAGLSQRPLVTRMARNEDERNSGENTAVCSWWDTEPQVDRVVNGLPGRVDRLKALGNAVVPQIPELIGRAILEASQ